MGRAATSNGLVKTKARMDCRARNRNAHSGAPMTRMAEIERLRVRYLIAVSERKHKTASLIYARLMSLTTRQLKAENRMDRRKAA